MTMAAAAGTPEPLIRWGYCWSALAGLGIMIAAIVIGNLWFLNFVHVFSSLLWTGIDLFMGFVLGPILRRMDISIRREVARRLTPRTLFLMPTISIISGTTGWFLAVELPLRNGRSQIPASYACLRWSSTSSPSSRGWLAILMCLRVVVRVPSTRSANARGSWMASSPTCRRG